MGIYWFETRQEQAILVLHRCSAVYFELGLMSDITSRQALAMSLVHGLWGEVHPQLRQASIAADENACIVRLRFEYDGPAEGPPRESCSHAASEVIADFPCTWSLDEQHVAVPFPNPLNSLAHLVYRRWEPDDAA